VSGGGRCRRQRGPPPGSLRSPTSPQGGGDDELPSPLESLRPRDERRSVRYCGCVRAWHESKSPSHQRVAVRGSRDRHRPIRADGMSCNRSNGAPVKSQPHQPLELARQTRAAPFRDRAPASSAGMPMKDSAGKAPRSPIGWRHPCLLAHSVPLEFFPSHFRQGEPSCPIRLPYLTGAPYWLRPYSPALPVCFLRTCSQPPQPAQRIRSTI